MQRESPAQSASGPHAETRLSRLEAAVAANQEHLWSFLMAESRHPRNCRHFKPLLVLSHVKSIPTVTGIGVVVITWQDLRDDAEQPQVLRARIATHMQLHLRGLSAEDRIVAADALSTKMEDDPAFQQEGSWDWHAHFEYALRPRTFGTSANIQVHVIAGFRI